jgi:hypothetical protein
METALEIVIAIIIVIAVGIASIVVGCLMGDNGREYKRHRAEWRDYERED